jgi:hypothetical protein
MFQPCQAALHFISRVNPCGLSSTPALSVPLTGICLDYYGFAQERREFVLPRLDKSRVDPICFFRFLCPFQINISSQFSSPLVQEHPLSQIVPGDAWP